MLQRVPLGSAEATYSAEDVSSMFLRNDKIPSPKKLSPLSHTSFQPDNTAACFQKRVLTGLWEGEKRGGIS
jgi:hypothetical protein